MNGYLLTASILIFLLALIHSVAGEVFLLRPMKNENLPVMFGQKYLSKRTIRLVWHITSAFAVPIGIAVAYLASVDPLDEKSVFFLLLTSGVMFTCFLISIIISRAQHPCWVAFLAIAVLCLAGIR